MLSGIQKDFPIDISSFNLPQQQTIRVMLATATGDMPAIHEMYNFRQGTCFKHKSALAPCMISLLTSTDLF